MSILQEKLSSQVAAIRSQRSHLIKQHGEAAISGVSVAQVYHGMRDVRAVVCDTSTVDPDKGLIIRGTPVSHLADRLPEEVFFLLITGELPTPAELADLRSDLAVRATVPDDVWDVIAAMAPDTHPMTALGTGVMAMERTSVFRARYAQDLARADQWQPALEDCLNLIARVPQLAAGIYRLLYGKGDRIAPDPALDWAANFAHMLGNDDQKFYEYLRLATVVQSDHEGSHASALACHVVGSTLADIYYAVPAGWNALAGPLHGLASQTSLDFVLGAMNKYGGIPSDEQIREYANATIDAGRIIPGYGHAVLRGQDPRYLAILAFGERNAPRDDVFNTVVRMSRVIPSILMDQGKVKNPWPNVDAINGSLFRHYGFVEEPYFTVFFASALSFGFCAQYVLNRLVNSPIVRPRSVTTEWIQQHVKDQ